MRIRSIRLFGVEALWDGHLPEPAVRSVRKEQPVLDESEFRAFYENTSRALFAYLLRVSREHAMAEDLVQESYCRLIAAKHIPGDALHRRKYLFRIATNLMRDRWRHLNNAAEGPLPDDLSDLAAPGTDDDLNIEVRRALQQLKGRERQLLWLAYVEGSNHREIAACTGLKEGSIRLLLFRARRKFAALIEGEPKND
jgi:RNA polymerase sigma-70 factor, ECF subfamily